jgi:hypothetical protein
MNLSPHTTLAEATRSDTAQRLRLDNAPNEKQLEAMKYLATNLFEPARDFVGGPLWYNSFFRSKKVNDAVGGEDSSQHTKGEAVDLDCDLFGGKTNAELFEYIKANLEFDQLIAEIPDGKGNFAWIHASLVNPAVAGRKNRKEVFVAKLVGKTASGKPKYKYERQ